MKKILFLVLAFLLLAVRAQAFTLYIYPYESGDCKGKVIGYSYDYKTFLYPNTGYSSTYHIEEIPENELLVRAILEDWNCNRYPEGKSFTYVIEEIKSAVADATGEMGMDNTQPINRTGHMTYGETCPLFCIDASGNLIYRGTDEALQAYFNP